MKGQISFDFILAVTVAMVLIASISVITQDINEMQKESVIRTKAKKISLEVARICSLSESLTQYEYSINYYIKKIISPETRQAIETDASISETSVTVTWEGESTGESTPMNYPEGPKKCIIEYLDQKIKLTITNI